VRLDVGLREVPGGRSQLRVAQHARQPVWVQLEHDDVRLGAQDELARLPRRERADVRGAYDLHGDVRLGVAQHGRLRPLVLLRARHPSPLLGVAPRALVVAVEGDAKHRDARGGLE